MFSRRLSLETVKQIKRFSSVSRINPLLQTDAYKLGHMEQYVPGCNKVYSYLEARSDRYFSKSVFYGLQYYLKEYLTKPVTQSDVDEFIKVKKNILGTVSDDQINKFNSLVDLGYWPIEIKAVPEGSVVPAKNAIMSITNTNSDFYWAVGYVESLLLKLWYSSSVATTSYNYYQMVDKFFNKTVDPENHFLKPFMVHDFGYRGDSSEEGAIISGVGHLLSFVGSDTIISYKGAEQYYNAIHTPDDPIMLTVPASEHSVMCSFGRDGELDCYKNMLEIYPTGIVSIVSDTYSIWNVLENFAPILKDDILARDGKVVFRPDSGNPEYIICGDPHADPDTPEGKGCLRLLEEVFGSSLNGKGYKELHPSVGLIYGDGIYLERYNNILTRMEEMGFAASNLVIGVGGILRNHTRDSLGYAIKATHVEVNGEERSIMKDPITDQKKKSKQGYMCLKMENGTYRTYDNVTKEEEKTGLLETVFKDGNLLKEYSLGEIRDRIRNTF